MADVSLINGGSGHRAQRTRVKKNGWTKTRRATFLKALAETCNVSLSTERAGMSQTSVYAMRQRDPVFAQLWDEALSIGYARLEALLLQRAIEGVNDIDLATLVDGEAVAGEEASDPPRGHYNPGSGMPRQLGRNEVQVALALLNRRGAKEGLRAGPRKLMSADEVDALLTKKLDALACRAGKQARGSAAPSTAPCSLHPAAGKGRG